mgnify:CR=1 FL=1
MLEYNGEVCLMGYSILNAIVKGMFFGRLICHPVKLDSSWAFSDHYNIYILIYIEFQK